MTTMLNVRDLRAYYGQVQALHGLERPDTAQRTEDCDLDLLLGLGIEGLHECRR